MKRILLILAIACSLAPAATAQRASGEPATTLPGAAPYPERQQAQVDPAKIAALLADDLPGGAVNPDERLIGSSADGRLDFIVRDQPVQSVFNQLRHALRRNVLVAPDVTATFTGDLYAVEPEEAVDLICRATGLVARDHGSYLYIEQRRVEMQLFPLRNIPAVDAEALIAPALSADGKVTATKESSTGLAAGEGETGGDAYANDGMLVVTDYPENLDNVRKILERVDRTPKQIMMEVTILSADLGANEQLGVNFDALVGVDYRDYGASSTDGFGVNDNVFSSEQMDDGLGRFGTGLADGLSTRGSQLGFITSGVAGFVRALREQTSVSIHTNTSVTVLNKQIGIVKLQQRDGFKTAITNQNGTTNEEVEYLETGSSFRVRPFLMDHDLVRMEIHPEDSDGGINEEGLPEEETANLTSNVAVRSGETLVIGGLFRERHTSAKGKVPGLGDVPGVGAAFRSHNDDIQRQELIFLITPHVVDLAAEAETAGLRSRRPAARHGADRAALAGMYTRTARALLLEDLPGCALALLQPTQEVDVTDPAVRELRRRLGGALVPAQHAPSVDARILDGLKREVLSLR